MRVVYGPEVFEQPYGGISRYFLEIHKRMPALGVNSTIVAGLHASRLITGEPRVRGIRIPAALEHRGFRVRNVMNRRLVQLQLVAAASPIYHMTYYSGAAVARPRDPVVVTVYDLIHARMPEQFPANDPTVAQQALACRRADIVLAISKTTKDDLVGLLGVSAGKVMVTPLGVTGTTLPFLTAAKREADLLLYVGRRGGYKNWRGFVTAMTEPCLRDVRLLCIGGGHFDDVEHALLASLGLSARVDQADCSDRELDMWYSRATAMVYPSLYEGFGLPPLEAMQRGCPVVAARAGSLPEVLDEAAVYVDPTSATSIATGIAAVLGDPNLAARLADAGRSRATAFSWDETARLTAAAYATLV